MELTKSADELNSSQASKRKQEVHRRSDLKLPRVAFLRISSIALLDKCDGLSELSLGAFQQQTRKALGSLNLSGEQLPAKREDALGSVFDFEQPLLFSFPYSHVLKGIEQHEHNRVYFTLTAVCEGETTGGGEQSSSVQVFAGASLSMVDVLQCPFDGELVFLVQESNERRLRELERDRKEREKKEREEKKDRERKDREAKEQQEKARREQEREKKEREKGRSVPPERARKEREEEKRQKERERHERREQERRDRELAREEKRQKERERHEKRERERREKREKRERHNEKIGLPSLGSRYARVRCQLHSSPQEASARESTAWWEKHSDLQRDDALHMFVLRDANDDDDSLREFNSVSSLRSVSSDGDELLSMRCAVGCAEAHDHHTVLEHPIVEHAAAAAAAATEGDPLGARALRHSHSLLAETEYGVAAGDSTIATVTVPANASESAIAKTKANSHSESNASAGSNVKEKTKAGTSANTHSLSGGGNASGEGGVPTPLAASSTGVGLPSGSSGAGSLSTAAAAFPSSHGSVVPPQASSTTPPLRGTGTLAGGTTATAVTLSARIDTGVDAGGAGAGLALSGGGGGVSPTAAASSLTLAERLLQAGFGRAEKEKERSHRFKLTKLLKSSATSQDLLAQVAEQEEVELLNAITASSSALLEVDLVGGNLDKEAASGLRLSEEVDPLSSRATHGGGAGGGSGGGVLNATDGSGAEVGIRAGGWGDGEGNGEVTVGNVDGESADENDPESAAQRACLTKPVASSTKPTTDTLHAGEGLQTVQARASDSHLREQDESSNRAAHGTHSRQHAPLSSDSSESLSVERLAAFVRRVLQQPGALLILANRAQPQARLLQQCAALHGYIVLLECDQHVDCVAECLLESALQTPGDQGGSHGTLLDDWDAQTSFRVSLAGTDAFVNKFVAALLRRLAMHPRSEAVTALSCLRFFLLPLGEPSLNTLAREIGARDATYRALFLDTEWLEALDRSVLSKANEKNVVQRILRYTMQASNLLRFPIGQAYITTLEAEHHLQTLASQLPTSSAPSASHAGGPLHSSASASPQSDTVSSSPRVLSFGDEPADEGGAKQEGVNSSSPASSSTTPALRSVSKSSTPQKAYQEPVRVRLPFLGSVHVVSLDDERGADATHSKEKEKDAKRTHPRASITPRTWANRPDVSMDIQLDYWTPHKREGKEDHQVSIKSSFQEVIVTRLSKVSGDIGIDPTYTPCPNTLSTLLHFREKKKGRRVKYYGAKKANGKFVTVTTSTTKLVCTPEHAKSTKHSAVLRVTIDGQEWDQIKFLSVTPAWASGFKTFPVCTF